MAFDDGEQLPLLIDQPQVADSAAGVLCNRPPSLAGELGNLDLLTTILGTANRSNSERLLTLYPNLRQLGAINSAVLFDLGFTPAAVRRLEALFELMKRHGETEWPAGEVFRGSGDIYRHFREHLAAEMQELFYAVLLDNKHRKIRDVLVSKGSLTASLVHPRDVFAQIVRHAAAAVLFVHNHPSGDPTPSREDLEITRRLREVGELIGIRVLDHIVIGQGRYVSFVDDGYW